MVTHELERVAPPLDRVAVLADRRVVAIGPAGGRAPRRSPFIQARISPRMTRKGRTMESKGLLPCGPACLSSPAGRAGGGGDLDERRAPGRAGGIHPALAPVGQRRTAKRRCSIAASRWARWSSWASTSRPQAECACAWRWTARCAQRPGVGAAGHAGLTGLTFVERCIDGGPPGATRPARCCRCGHRWQDTTSKLPAALGERANWGERLISCWTTPTAAGWPDLLANLTAFRRSCRRWAGNPPPPASARQLADEFVKACRQICCAPDRPRRRPDQRPPEPGRTLPRLDQLASQ